LKNVWNYINFVKHLMSNKNEKIGVGIVTCNRKDYFLGCVNSIDTSSTDCVVVVNDGKEYTDIKLNDKIVYIQNEKNLGVAKSKNKVMKHLFSEGCDYIFIIEDDMAIKDQTVFQQYIEACKATGIQHFNYGPGSPFNRKQTIQNFDLHNRHLLDEETEPNPRLVIDYKTCKIALYTHIAGTFSFFTRKVLDQVGFIDESFVNAWEHVDHTYQIIQAKHHPPFWWFADIYNSHFFIEPQKGSIENSTTAKNTNEWMTNVQKNAEIYKIKNGHYPAQTPLTSEEELVNILKQIKQNI